MSIRIPRRTAFRGSNTRPKIDHAFAFAHIQEAMETTIWDSDAQMFVPRYSPHDNTKEQEEEHEG